MYSKKNREDIRNLWKLCFQDSEEYLNYYMEYKMADNQVLMSYEENKLTSMVHLNPFRFQVLGSEYTLNYIVGVATDPAFRKQGRMRTLLKEAFDKMYLAKQPFTYLMPAKESIYLPFDFRYIYEQDRITIVKASHGAKENDASEDLDFRLGTLRPSEYKSLADLTNQYLKENFQIFTLRDSYYYERLKAEMRAAGGDVLAIYSAGQLIGCCAYMMEGNQIEAAETFITKESNQSFAEELLDFIEGYSAGVSAAEIHTSQVKQLADSACLYGDINEKDASGHNEGVQGNLTLTFLESFFLGEDFVTDQYKSSGLISSSVKPIIMARIINFTEFAKLLRSSENIGIDIRIEDPFLSENNQIFHLDINEDSGQAAIMSGDIEPEVVLTISEAVELFFGRKRIEEMVSTGIIEVKDTAIWKLNKINSLNKVYINEIV